MPKSGEDTQLFSSFTAASKTQWREAAVESLRGKSLEKLQSQTYEGLELEPMYWPSDVEGLKLIDSLPGAPPFLRGTRVTGAGWSVCQELLSVTPEAFNAEARADLERGQDALGLVLDWPSRRGLDVDQAPAEQVGRGGTSLCCLDDYHHALDGVDLGATALHFDVGPTAVPELAHLAALVAAAPEEQELELSKLRGCVGADPLGELAATGELSIPLPLAWDMMAASARWALDRAPGLRTALVRGCLYHEAGASAVEELGAAIATGVEVIRALGDRGLRVDQVAPQLRFTFSLGANFFMEVAKLRAARVLWAQVVEAFGGDAAVQQMEIHGRTSGWTKTTCDPWVNMLRNTTEALSGVLGGADSLHVRPFDEHLRPGGEFSRRISRNVQLLLSQESHLSHPIDPGGGAWYLESITDELGRAAWEFFQEIEAEGGMARALQTEMVQRRIAAVADSREIALGQREDVMVGTNKYPNLDERPLDVPDIDPKAVQGARLDALERYRTATASADDHTAALEALSCHEQRTDAGLIDAVIAAVEAGSTLGDMLLALVGEGGEGMTIEPLVVGRASEPFEQLRDAADRHAARTGRRISVFLASIGPLRQHKARTDFSTDFFAVGGFEVLSNDGFDTAEAAARAALSSGAPIVVICSSDDAYPEVVAPLTRAIKAERPEVTVILAGRPATAELEASWREAGLEHAIHLGSNCSELLAELQERTGVTDER